MTAKQSQQGCFQKALYQNDKHQTAQQLHGLPPPGSAVGELQQPVVKYADHQHTPYSPGHAVGVFNRMGKVVRIDPGREGEEREWAV